MTPPASAKPLAPAAKDRLDSELAEITAIYRRLFPDQPTDLVLFQGETPITEMPHVHEGPMTLRAHHLGPQFIGRVSLPGASSPRVTVVATIPRAPTEGEFRRIEAPWHPQARLSRLFALSPMLYEQVRYGAEMFRRRRLDRRHSHTPLPIGGGSPWLPDLQQPQTEARPSILIGFHWLEVGGAEKLAFDSVTWALEAGLRVFVVASVPALQRLADRLPDHPDVVFLRLDRYLPHHLWPRFLEKLALTENLRLVHIHHCQPLYESLPHLRVTAPWVKVIDSTHIVEFADGGYPRIAGVWSNFIDLHHVISGELQRYFSGRFGLAGKVRLGRMLTRHDSEGAPQAANMQAGQTKLRLAFVGRMYYQKRPVVLVEILRALDKWASRQGIELSATIVGEGPFEGAVGALLRRYGLAEKVALQRANADIPGLLSQSDILLLPSNNEGLALVCYEAIEHGCIPISTDVGSQDEIVPAPLMVPLPPRETVRATVRAVARLWSDADFLSEQWQALSAARARLAADPTAAEVLLPIYRAAAASQKDPINA